MKKILLLLMLFSRLAYAIAQDPVGEKLKQQLDAHPQQDSFRVNLLNELYFYSGDDKYSNEALAISQKITYPIGKGYALVHIGFSKSIKNFRREGDSMLQQAGLIATKAGNLDLLATQQVYNAYSTVFLDSRKGLALLLTAEKTSEKAGNTKLLSICQYFIAIEYANGLSDFAKGVEYFLKAVHTAEQTNYLRSICNGFIALGRLYSRMDDQANASLFFQKAKEANQQLKSPGVESELLVQDGKEKQKAGKYVEAIDIFKQALNVAKNVDSGRIIAIQLHLAEVYTSMDSLPLAFKNEFSSLKYAKKIDDRLLLAEVVVPLARTYLNKKMPDSSIYYASMGYDLSRKIGAVEVMRDNAEVLTDAYAYKKDFSNAYTWHLHYVNYRDSVVNTEVRNKSAVIQYNNDLAKKQEQITALHQQKKMQQNFLYTALALLIIIIITAFMLLKNNRQKQKANKLLQTQKREIENQRDQINEALGHLQQTQTQLVQSEKMASLGELTAGIAHEIQNPLNFVNNFSELNNELIDELKAKRSKLKADDNGEETDLLNDIYQNNEKINHHGKRADAIVKGMLQHSRSSSGLKEPTDINELADEYLRLAYHGLRAKDNSFNVTIKTNFDEGVGKINIIPQDMGRVILNLITNAFYVVDEKKKQALSGYEPVVSVETKKEVDKVFISVKDNGNGIPANVVDKIFQPFFTTKPTGQGTGLGLSLSYDIVKAHGGEIRVETKEGEGTEFTIHLPITIL